MTAAQTAVVAAAPSDALQPGSVHAAKAAALRSADDARAEGFTVVDPGQVVGRLRVAHGVPHAVASDIKARVAGAVAARSIPVQPTVLGQVHHALFNYHRTGRLTSNQPAWAPAVFHLHLAAGTVCSSGAVMPPLNNNPAPLQTADASRPWSSWPGSTAARRPSSWP